MNIIFSLFQQGPAETTGYFIAGYAVFFVVSVIYLASYFLRFNNLKKDLALLEELEEESA